MASENFAWMASLQYRQRVGNIRVYTSINTSQNRNFQCLLCFHLLYASDAHNEGVALLRCPEWDWLIIAYMVHRMEEPRKPMQHVGRMPVWTRRMRIRSRRRLDLRLPRGLLGAKLRATTPICEKEIVSAVEGNKHGVREQLIRRLCCVPVPLRPPPMQSIWYTVTWRAAFLSRICKLQTQLYQNWVLVENIPFFDWSPWCNILKLQNVNDKLSSTVVLDSQLWKQIT